LESISPSDLALELLNYCLRGATWPTDLLETLVRCALHPDEERAREGTHALFGIVVERLADLFEPALCDTYAALFADVVEFACPEYRAKELLARYRRIRLPRRFTGDTAHVHDVIVLSRVTLGADVAITSLILDAAKRRFPNARIHLAGTRKSYELFEADPRIAHLPVAYGRSSTLRGRLAAWPDLAKAAAGPGTIIIDPDSRITQLGILPLGAEDNYYFFESRGYGEYGPEPLGELTRRWLADTFDIADAKAYLAPAVQPHLDARPIIAVSFGVGENPSKRIRDPFEEDLLRALAERDAVIAIDKGAGGEERDRVERAVARSGATVHALTGSFAEFAAVIAQSALYVGYDSAGQHVAAACQVPLVTVFAGFVSARMLNRWHPFGSGPIAVVPVHDPDPEIVLAETLRALLSITAS
jgi:ADP-heptose:LPS heptosyltransferase